MVDPCVLVSKGLAENWCERCELFHVGKNAEYAAGTDAASVAMREKWMAAKKKTKDPRVNWLRSPRIAMTCIHLDPHKLSNTEAQGMEDTAKKLETSCRDCTGQTALQRCHGGGGHDGYTALSYCVNKCTIFQGKLTDAN